MDVYKALLGTEKSLSQEGENLSDLLETFRSRIAPTLIGEAQWQQIIECGERLPIEAGAVPFGFEIPLQNPQPIADLGVSIARQTKTATFFDEAQRRDKTDGTTNAVVNLLRQLDAQNSKLLDITGDSFMLEFDIGSAPSGASPGPGVFLYPTATHLLGSDQRIDDVLTVVDALVSCVDWSRSDLERETIKHIHRVRPDHTGMESFGVFPARSGRSVRIGVNGFKNLKDLRTFLENTGWPGKVATVESVISRIQERAPAFTIGLGFDIQENGLGPTLGLIVKRGNIHDSRYWLNCLEHSDRLLDAVRDEDIIIPEKIEDLVRWKSNVAVRYAKFSRFLMFCGLHHIKGVLLGDQLTQIKAYLFAVLTSAIEQ